jgi:hypothetical protein
MSSYHNKLDAGTTTTITLPNNSPYDYSVISVNSINTISAGLTVAEGNLNIDSGDIKIKGVSLAEALTNIESRLAILRPNPDLEERWDKLKELGDQYRQLEAELISKEKMWAILNR